MDATDIKAEFLERLSADRPRRSGGVALHWQSADLLRHTIEALHYPPAVPLPPEKELASALGVSRPTLRQAIARLANEGVIHSQRGIGSFALRGSLVRPASLASLYDDLIREGRHPSAQVLELDTVAADETLATAMQIAVGDRLTRVRRVRYADGVPVALVESRLSLPAGVELRRSDLETDGLYHLLSSKANIELVSGTQSVSARLATAEEVEYLDIVAVDAVMVAERIAFDAKGRGVESSSIIYPAGTELHLSDLRSTSFRAASAS